MEEAIDTCCIFLCRIYLEEMRKNAKKMCLAAGVWWDLTPPLYEDTFRTYMVFLLAEFFSKCGS